MRGQAAHGDNLGLSLRSSLKKNGMLSVLIRIAYMMSTPKIDFHDKIL